MKIQFDSTLQFQLDSISSIVDIFQGQEVCNSNFSVYSPEYLSKQQDMSANEIGYGNRLTISEGELLDNIQQIQLSNGLQPSSAKEISQKHLDFTVEMETGTGKTYVYLRTIMELYQKYGFSKHIIVVPSISIKEGVFKSLQITQSHLRELFNNVLYNFFIYDSSKLNEVRAFSSSDGLEIMVINIDAFSKSFEDPAKLNNINIIHRYNDSLGYKPLELIQNTNPFVFIDEPQTAMSTDLRKKAVSNLNPLATIRYSATHKEKVNLMYKLDAVNAYEQKLVKQVEVGSVQTEGSNNQAYIKLIEVKLSKSAPVAKIEVDAFVKGSIKRKRITVRQNDDLEQLNDRAEYEGYIINDIHGAEGKEYIDFTSRDESIKLGQSIGNVDERQVKTSMISKTIEEHLDKELKLNGKGIKVLSLFFIDSVAKYRKYDEDGNQEKGVYAKVFEAEYTRLIRKQKYQQLFDNLEDPELDASLVHNGYFSIDKKGRKSNSKDKFEFFKDTSGSTKADEGTYNLIMRDKEKLLSFDSKLRFIFSHSALKEGWDNPNVFQICTLRDIGGSSVTPRQQVGRGLRLCVNQKGEREFGHDVNILSVIATESYFDFVNTLQKEIEDETGIKFGIIEEFTFSGIVTEIKNGNNKFLGEKRSRALYAHLKERGYIDSRGKVQDLLRIAINSNTVDIPEAFNGQNVVKQILTKLKTAAGRLEIKNKADKKRIKANKRVLDSPEFKELWERVKFKTTFSVKLDSVDLVEKCIASINQNLAVQKGRLHYTKATITMNSGGLLTDDKSLKTRTSLLENTVTHLPDIISYLQNETQLTRLSIVDVLTGIENLNLFTRNPQKFIEECIKIINEQMRLQITDGIKYQKIGDNDFYSQELFQNEELFGYLKANLSESYKSPYEYIVFDSQVESAFSKELEQSENVNVYAKLPDWFKIDTPLGAYNPDWVISWKDEGKNNKIEKLYFVVETKGSTSQMELRPKESLKIKCGKKHFEALDSEMIVAKSIKDLPNGVSEKENDLPPLFLQK